MAGLKIYYDETKNSAAIPNANLESHPCNAPHGKEGFERQDKVCGFRPCEQRCSIHIHGKRNRIVDPDGQSGKYVIDAIVEAKILSDDTTEQISKVTYSQAKTRGEEETEIIIEWKTDNLL